MDFTVKPRRSLIVYMHSMKQVRQLKRFGLIQYQSRKEHYVVLYMDESQIPAATTKIKKLNFVSQPRLVRLMTMMRIKLVKMKCEL